MWWMVMPLVGSWATLTHGGAPCWALADNNKAEAGRAAAAAAAARQRWGRAGMAVGFTIKARNLIDPNRRMMDRIARRNPRGLTTHMLSELSRRANVEDVLGMVSPPPSQALTEGGG